MASAEGAIDAYLGFEIERDLLAGTLTLSQKHYSRDPAHIRRLGMLSLSYSAASRTTLGEKTPPDRPFHLRYPGIVGSWGYQLG